MNTWTVVAALLAGLGMSVGAKEMTPQSVPQVSATRNVAACTPRGDVNFICGLSGPEDFVRIPGTNWIVVSATQGGPIQLIHTRHHTVLPALASPLEYRFDAASPESCPGPFAIPPGSPSSMLGLNIRAGAKGIHTLYVVHHGFRESIEVFEVNAAPGIPRLTWVNCILAPDGADRKNLNSIAPLPDGGLVATFPVRTAAARADLLRAFAGEETGAVHEWQPRRGWTVVPGSTGPFPNGIEASRDGRSLYVALTGIKKVMRLSRGLPRVERTTVDVSFHPDNLRWQEDGSLTAAGEYAPTPDALLACLTSRRCEGTAARAARIDTRTLKAEDIASYPTDDASFFATAALLVDKEIWVGSVRGDRLARYPAR